MNWVIWTTVFECLGLRWTLEIESIFLNKQALIQACFQQWCGASAMTESWSQPVGSGAGTSFIFSTNFKFFTLTTSHYVPAPRACRCHTSRTNFISLWSRTTTRSEMSTAHRGDQVSDLSDAIPLARSASLVLVTNSPKGAANSSKRSKMSDWSLLQAVVSSPLNLSHHERLSRLALCWWCL